MLYKELVTNAFILSAIKRTHSSGLIGQLMRAASQAWSAGAGGRCWRRSAT